METIAGTVFGAYNSLTGNLQIVRSSKSDEAKFKSIMDQTAKQKARTAFNLCRDFAMQVTADRDGSLKKARHAIKFRKKMYH